MFGGIADLYCVEDIRKYASSAAMLSLEIVSGESKGGAIWNCNDGPSCALYLSVIVMEGATALQ